MTWWLVLFYSAGWLVVGRAIAVNAIDEEANREIATRNRVHRSRRETDEPLVDMETRMTCIFLGFSVALVWPVVVLVWSLGKGFRSPAERKYARQTERDATRKLAREHGLPSPEDDDR